MKSKVNEYQDIYGQYQQCLNNILSIEQPLEGIIQEISDYREKQNELDYNNSAVVLAAMQKYVENATREKEKELHKEIDAEVSEIQKSEDKLRGKINLVLKWITADKCKSILNKQEIDLSKSSNIDNAMNDKKLSITSAVNNVFAHVFRFKFLKFLPPILRVIAGIIAWGGLLVPQIYKIIFASYNDKYQQYLWGLEGSFYEQERLRIVAEFTQSTITMVAIVAILFLMANLGIFICCKFLASKYVNDYSDIFRVYFDANDFKNKLYDKKIEAFRNEQVSVWKKEIKTIEEGSVDLTSDGECFSIYVHVRELLKKQYDDIEKVILELSSKVKDIQEKANYERVAIDKLLPKLSQKSNELTKYVDDDDYNDWILTPYVSIGYSKALNEDVRELMSFEHNYKPIILCYSEETRERGEKFRKNEARLIELFMNGFFWENNYELINMWLVNFGGLHFPESRTQGLMTVVDTQQELHKLYEELKQTSKLVNSLGDGHIQNINPVRKQNREKPIKYNIVFFVGNNFKAIDNEVAQLFVRGADFGFLPIIFLEQSEVKAMLDDKNMNREFSDVLKMAKENEQIYSYEGLVSEIEYNLVVSDQKEFLIQKHIYSDKFMSFDEFWQKATSDEGVDLSETLVVDTYNLPQELYDGIIEATDDCVFFMAGNKDVPDYLPKESIKKLF